MSLKMIFVLPLFYLFPKDSESEDNYLIKKKWYWNIRNLSRIEGKAVSLKNWVKFSVRQMGYLFVCCCCYT